MISKQKELQVFDDEIVINLRFKKIDENTIERRKLFSVSNKKQIYKLVSEEIFPYNNFIQSMNAKTNAINWAKEIKADVLLIYYNAILKGEIKAKAFKIEK